MKVDLDKFYTKPEIAEKCVNLIADLETYDEIIEPSAGNGSFSDLIKNIKAFDIAPEKENIVKQDFFELSNLTGNHLLFVGNPPFGQRSILAKNFIQHAIILGAETIAFILPNTFSKLTMQKVFPENWALILVEDLGRDAFEIDGETYHVPCSFYIWTQRASKINLRKKKLPQPSEFQFLPRESQNADFVLNGNSGKIKPLSAVTNSKAEHYVKVCDEKNIIAIKQKLENLDYGFNSSVNGGVAWISQQEILEAWYANHKSS